MRVILWVGFAMLGACGKSSASSSPQGDAGASAAAHGGTTAGSAGVANGGTSGGIEETGGISPGGTSSGSAGQAGASTGGEAAGEDGGAGGTPAGASGLAGAATSGGGAGNAGLGGVAGGGAGFSGDCDPNARCELPDTEPTLGAPCDVEGNNCWRDTKSGFSQHCIPSEFARCCEGAWRSVAESASFDCSSAEGGAGGAP